MTTTQARPTTAGHSSLFPWRRVRGAQHPALKAAQHDRTLGERVAVIMMSQNRAAARDEVLAQHHYEETLTIDKLLQANTDLTQQVHDLTRKVHLLTEHLCRLSGVELTGAGIETTPQSDPAT